MDSILFEIVPEIVKHLAGWRCDVRGHWPRILGPEGAYITTRMERGNRIHFYAPPPAGPSGHRSWQGWEVSREEWSQYSITCSATRAPNQIARDLSRRLLAKVVIYWPLAMARKREEQARLETLQHVTNLFLKVLEGSSVSTWNSCHHRKNIGFPGGSCVVSHYSANAALKFDDLSYGDALKIAAFYQQLLGEKKEKI